MAKRAKGGGKKGAPPANGSKPGDNGAPLSFDDERALFLHHRKIIEEFEAQKAVVQVKLDAAYADAKADGKFTKEEFRIARDLAASPRREAKVAGDVRKRLRVARFLGHKMGDQFDLFEQPDRTPALERAFDAGKLASMEGAPRKPPHSPETTLYAAWMSGFDEDQKRLAAGVGRGREGVRLKDGEPVTSGTPVARSEFKRTVTIENPAVPAAIAPGTMPEKDVRLEFMQRREAEAEDPKLPPAAQTDDQL